jgi:hypothetical protein
MMFWIVLAVVIGALCLLAWWLSGPRFNGPPYETLPRSHRSPGLPRSSGNGGGGAGA